MRKYALTDPDGSTPKGERLEPGKFIEDARSGKDLLARLGAYCGDSPLVAALVSPLATEDGARMFQINRWKVSADPTQAQMYTVVKEVTPVPRVTLEQKLAFALLVLLQVYKNKNFQVWAQRRLSGEDRSFNAAQTMRHLAERELAAADDLEVLAAWGVAGGSDTETAKDMDRLAHGVLHAARAAELLSLSRPDARQAGEELMQAFAAIMQYAGRIDLAALAKQATGGEAADPNAASEA